MHDKLIKLKSEIVSKGWGFEKIIVNNTDYCGKILHFNKGAKFSGHLHREKRETFFILDGYVKVTGINTENAEPYFIFLQKGEILDIPRNTIHQIEALEETDIIEFSTCHKDSDSYRYFPGDSQKYVS